MGTQAKASCTRRGWLDKKPSSGLGGCWKRRWVVLTQNSAEAKISWYAGVRRAALARGARRIALGLTTLARTETPRPTHASHPTHTPQMRFEAWPESTPAVPGVTVASVEEGSPAAAAGLVAGSIVYSINNIPVSARVVVGR